MDSSRMFSAVDAILQERDLRAMWPPIFFYADIFSGHASQAAYPRRGGRSGDVRGVRRERLAALHAGGARLARHRAAHRLPDLPLSVLGLLGPSDFIAL